ncbi:hypothetical protein J7L87_05735 [bacterium]|nr:hypothetical protein [bacterium]
MFLLKELKEKRIFFIGFLLLIFFSRIIPVFFKNTPNFEPDLYVDIIAVLIFIFIPLAFGAISFSEENKEVEEFVLSLPVKPYSVFWSKFFTGFSLSFILTLIFFFLLLTYTFTRIEDSFITFKMLFFNLFFMPAFISSLLFRKFFLSLLLSPLLILIFMFSFNLPLFPFFILISSSLKTLIFLLFIINILFPLSYGFFIWKKGVFGRENKVKSFLKISIIVLLISYGTYSVSLFYVDREFQKTIKFAEKNKIPTSIEEIIPPPVPEKENGATYLNKAFKLISRLEKKYKEEWKYMPFEGDMPLKKLTEKHIRKWEKIFETSEFKEFFSLVEKGIEMKRCRFDIDYKKPLFTQLEHLYLMRKIARILCARTYIYIFQKKHQKAFNTLMYAIKLGDCLEEEPILISYLVKNAIDCVTIKRIEDFLNSDFYITEEECKSLISLIEEKDTSIKKAIEGEFLEFFQRHKSSGFLFMYATYHPFQKEKIKINPVQVIPFKIYLFYYWKIIGLYDLSFSLKNLITTMGRVEKPYYIGKREEWEKKYEIFDFLKHPFNLFFFSLSVPSLRRVKAIYDVYLDCAKISLALRIYKNRYGKYPEKLQSLTPDILSSLPLDPFTGQNYIYRKKKDGFITYSVGPNGKDDKGERNCKKNRDDISFKISR